MANKVLSIKMDEKDIERLKKYYGALVSAGFFSAKMVSLNAFLKHILLDYLDDDINRAFQVFTDYGISPQSINPHNLGDNEEITLINTYNLNTEMFEAYKECVKENLSKYVEQMKDIAEIFNEVVESNVIVTEGVVNQLQCVSVMDTSKENISFWETKAIETIDFRNNTYRKDEIEEEIVMIENSSIPNELKQKIIGEIREYEEKRKQNYNIMQGRGIIK